MKNRFYTYAKCCFINIKDSYTYEPFLNSLSELTLQEQKYYNLNNIQSYLKFLPIFQFSTTYIKLRILDEEELISNLTKIIKDRFNMLINSAAKQLICINFQLSQVYRKR